MSERRYSEEEVAEIFERATEAQKVAVRPSRVPGWARLRQSQFEQVAGRFASSLGNSNDGADVGGEPASRKHRVRGAVS